MDEVDQIESEQSKIWNGHAGRTWVEAQDLLDQMFTPFETVLAVEPPRPGSWLLDVGCGTGSTTLMAARACPDRHCVGVDISQPMLELARTRATQDGLAAEFICADAQAHRFELGRFDTIISRFGVMFFADPVQAFANLRRATRDDGHLRFLVWRGLEENPFMVTAERAAAPFLPSLPPREPNAPGQFALADRHRTAKLLRDGGWTGIDIAPLDVECAMPADKLDYYIAKMGPVGVHLQQADDRVRAELVPILQTAFSPYVQGDQVRFHAACWVIDAKAG